MISGALVLLYISKSILNLKIHQAFNSVLCYICFYTLILWFSDLCMTLVYNDMAFMLVTDVPTEPSTSPFISSLSLSSSEENIGKKLLRKLSEQFVMSSDTTATTHTRCQMCLNFSASCSNGPKRLLATRDVSCLYNAAHCFLQSGSSRCSCSCWHRFMTHAFLLFCHFCLSCIQPFEKNAKVKEYTSFE